MAKMALMISEAPDELRPVLTKMKMSSSKAATTTTCWARLLPT